MHGTTVQMPVLRAEPDNRQGRTPDQDKGAAEAALLQRLPAQIHAAPTSADPQLSLRAELSRLRHALTTAHQHLEQALAALSEQVRTLFYEVTLAPHVCPTCAGALKMIRDGCCQCRNCRLIFDPTVALQRCACGGRLRLRIRRYECRACGREVPSGFLYDGKVFDAEYFRERMRLSRARIPSNYEPAANESIRAASSPAALAPIDLQSVPGLLAALNGLTGALDASLIHLPESHRLALAEYEEHLRRHVSRIPIKLERVPPLRPADRLDHVWRFVAAVFLAHAGFIELHQAGPTILLTLHETHRERPGVPAPAAAPHADAGSPG